MGSLNGNAKKMIANALDEEKSAMFVANGKLFSLEVHDAPHVHDGQMNLAEEIESYRELKESLRRYTDNPIRKRYTAKEFQAKRHKQNDTFGGALRKCGIYANWPMNY